MPQPLHHATHRKGRIVGHGEGNTPDEARRAAIIDANDQHALEQGGEAPFRPGTATIVGAITLLATLALGLLLLVKW